MPELNIGRLKSITFRHTGRYFYRHDCDGNWIDRDMGGATILIVEDEFEHGIELKLMLERNGHVVLGPAPDCSAALEILWRARPDFAFVDTHLGSETCEAVLEECAQQEVPVIITTSEITGTPNFVGDHHHLRKPLMQSMLGPAIEMLRG